MKQKRMDPLHSHCLCIDHAWRYKPRRSGIQFFFISPDLLPEGLVCGRCAPHKVVRGGLMVSEQSLKACLVPFLKNAAFDIKDLTCKAQPLIKKMGGVI